MVWSVAQHDTIPSVELHLTPLESHAYLSGFLYSAGAPFSPPYTGVRDAIKVQLDVESARRRPAQAPSASVSDQRLRTWRSTLENLGFFFVDGAGNLALTPLGRATKHLYEEVNDSIEGANDHLAKLAVDVLARHTLRNPIDSGEYPADCDIHPFKVIWKAMRHLGDKLHWQEMNRVLMHVEYSKDIDAAIARIREKRSMAGGGYGDEPHELGAPAVNDGAETKRRVTPWFTRAGFGGLLISTDDDERGFRSLNAKHIPLIDQALSEEHVVPATALQSASAYRQYLTMVPMRAAGVSSESDKKAVEMCVEAVRRYGDRRVICLSGPPSTGKTRLARLVAEDLTDGDPYRLMEIQFHENMSYDDFIEGFAPRPSGDGFTLVPKTLRILNRRARLDPQKLTYVLLIEEFTRANVHGVLGELLTYIEHRDRTFRLALSQEEERIAPNLRVIATMNPRDRSAINLDVAIARRLYRIELQGSEEALRTMLKGKLDPGHLASLLAWYREYAALLPFGHGVFSQVSNVDDLRDVWQGTMIHMMSDAVGAVREPYARAADAYPWK